MTIEERLDALSIDKPTKQRAPKTDTQATLLSQGLQSQDQQILDVSTLRMCNNAWLSSA